MKRCWFTGFLLCLATSASAQSAPSVTHYYLYDVGVISTSDNWTFRLNQNGQMTWNQNGHAYL